MRESPPIASFPGSFYANLVTISLLMTRTSMNSPNVLRELAQHRLTQLRSEIRSLNEAIATLKSDGLIAAKGTAITSYKARSGSGGYWDYFKVTEKGNRTLIHLGKEGSEWLDIFRMAIKRRTQLNSLEQHRERLRQEIDQIKAALTADPLLR